MGNNCIGLLNQEQKPDIGEQSLRPQVEDFKRIRTQKKTKVQIQHNLTPLKICQNIRILSKTPNQADLAFIHKSLQTHFLFSQLAQQERCQISKSMFYCQIDQNQYLFRQGDKASSFFILEKGECQLIIDNVSKKKLVVGDTFGELALLYCAPRSASIKAVVHCSLWLITRAQFKKAAQQLASRNFKQIFQIINKVKQFDFLTESQKQAIASIGNIEFYKPGQVIISQGQPANSFYAIKQGVAMVSFEGRQIKKMGPNQSFGQQALHNQSSRRTMTVTALSQVLCISLGRQNIMNVIGDKVHKIINMNRVKWTFQNCPTLKGVSELQLERILANLLMSNKRRGQIIIQKESYLNVVFLILRGNIIGEDNKVVCQSFRIFQPEIMLEQFPRQIFADLSVTQDCKMASIPLQIVKQIINTPQEILDQKVLHAELQQLIVLKQLGNGLYSNKLFLVESPKDQMLMTLKCIKLNDIQINNSSRQVLNQKECLELCNNKFVLKLYKSFKDRYNIYFLTQYINGIELFFLLREVGLLNYNESRFFVAALILAVQHLHELKIVHRDIKPQNIIVGVSGYPKLIDFGTSKVLKSSLRTFTLIGTPHYTAPEVISGKGYSFAVDIWSIGICLYQFLCGSLPYAQNLDDPYKVYQTVLNTNYVFPLAMTDKQSKKFINQLLSKSPQMRTGGSYLALKQNKWFQNLDFQLIRKQDLKSPLPPRKKDVLQNELTQKLRSQGRNFSEFVKKQFGGQIVDKPFEWQSLFN